jgi:DNA-binding transcriptional LysR family regulator
MRQAIAETQFFLSSSSITMSKRKHPTEAAFELRHLRYFVAVAEEQNFNRAAERLGIAQPGLSQQISSLETIVGTALLDRSRRLFQLTLPGQIFLQEARRTLAQANTTLAAVKRAARGETGRISIGYVASAAYSGLLTASISTFRDAYPEVDLKLTELDMMRQLAMIAEGSLDFAYIRPPVPIPRGIATNVILREPLVVIVPQAHRLASATELRLDAFSNDTFITAQQPPDVGFHRNTIDACYEAGFSPVINAVGRDFTTIASMVAVGLGIALAPCSLSCLQLPGVHYKSVFGITTSSDLAVAYRRNEASPAVKAFIQHTREVKEGRFAS